MKNLLRSVLCLTPFLAVLGCGGVPEEKPPEKAPEMTPEETKHMNDEIEKMKGQYQPPQQ